MLSLDHALEEAYLTAWCDQFATPAVVAKPLISTGLSPRNILLVFMKRWIANDEINDTFVIVDEHFSAFAGLYKLRHDSLEDLVPVLLVRHWRDKSSS